MNIKSNILIAGAVIVVVGIISFVTYQGFSSSKTAEKEIQDRNQANLAEALVQKDTNETSRQQEQGIQATSSAKTSFIASKNGTRYFPITCGSAKTIKPENAIYFDTVELAEGAGYTQSLQCKY